LADGVSDLRYERPVDDAALQDWRYVHNVIIPSHELSLEDVRERAQRNRLEVAYLGDEPIGCTTVRPPTSDSPAVTVIARVLPAHRRRGFGEELYARALDYARTLDADTVETVVLASNTDGLRFAQNHGYTEIETYLLPGDTVPYIDLRLAIGP
jgi:GNAT superfamily N-acetyltransferase